MIMIELVSYSVESDWDILGERFDPHISNSKPKLMLYIISGTIFLVFQISF